MSTINTLFIVNFSQSFREAHKNKQKYEEGNSHLCHSVKERHFQTENIQTLRHDSHRSLGRSTWTHHHRRLQKQQNFAMRVWGMGGSSFLLLWSALSLHNAGLSCSQCSQCAWWKKRDPQLTWSFTNSNVHVCFRTANTAFVCLIKESTCRVEGVSSAAVCLYRLREVGVWECVAETWMGGSVGKKRLF